MKVSIVKCETYQQEEVDKAVKIDSLLLKALERIRFLTQKVNVRFF